MACKASLGRRLGMALAETRSTVDCLSGTAVCVDVDDGTGDVEVEEGSAAIGRV